MLKIRENLPVAYIFKHPQKAWSVVLIIHVESRAALNAKVILLLAIVTTSLMTNCLRKKNTHKTITHWSLIHLTTRLEIYVQLSNRPG